MNTPRTRKPTFRQIETFRAVLTAGSMKVAASAMSISQPAVSKIMKSLEEDLGMRLFLRTKGGLLPSEAARTLHRHTEHLFVGLEEFADLATQLRERRTGHLRIAAMSAMSISFLPRVIGRFLAHRPGVTIDLDTHGSGEVVRHVRARRYDLGIAMPPVDFVGVEILQTIAVRCACLLPAGHALARRRVITPELLREADFVSLAEGSLTRLRIDEVFASRNVARRIRVSARSPESVANFVRGNQGVAVVDPFTAAHHRKLGGVVRPFEPTITSAVSFVRPRGTEVTALMQDFITALQASSARYLL